MAMGVGVYFCVFFLARLQRHLVADCTDLCTSRPSGESYSDTFAQHISKIRAPFMSFVVEMFKHQHVSELQALLGRTVQ